MRIEGLPLGERSETKRSLKRKRPSTANGSTHLLQREEEKRRKAGSGEKETRILGIMVSI
jgi:hypothetical protein